MKFLIGDFHITDLSESDLHRFLLEQVTEILHIFGISYGIGVMGMGRRCDDPQLFVVVIALEIFLEFVAMFQVKGKQVHREMKDEMFLIFEGEDPGIERIMVVEEFLDLTGVSALCRGKRRSDVDL